MKVTEPGENQTANDSGSFFHKGISFPSGENSCRGYLYLPSGHISCCVVLANGFSGTMDWNLPAYAERFAQAGLAALIFDYRYFGESGGEPRQLIHVNKQRDDIRSAIRFVKTHPYLSGAKIVLWGTSLGGGHVFNIAAEDPSLAAVITQVPGIDMASAKARATIKVPGGMTLRIIFSAIRDGIHGLLGLKPYYIKVFSDEGETAVFTDPKLKARFELLENSKKTWKNKFTPRFYLSLPRYKPGTAEKIVMPLLMCIADKEVYTNKSFQDWIGSKVPKAEVKHYDAEHFDFYQGEVFERVIEHQIRFIQQHVNGTSS